jgi:hypothetical protein
MLAAVFVAVVASATPTPVPSAAATPAPVVSPTPTPWGRRNPPPPKVLGLAESPATPPPASLPDAAKGIKLQSKVISNRPENRAGTFSDGAAKSAPRSGMGTKEWVPITNGYQVPPSDHCVVEPVKGAL